MKKILLSLGVVAFAAALVAGGTGAFFSDEEVSSGNTFTAGSIDLGIDNESYYNGEANPGTSWLEVAFDLDDGAGPSTDGKYLFFEFDDLKPGDYGEDTISIHVNNNESWLCADVTLTSDDDNALTEPEEDDGDDTDGVGEGELASAVEFIWWADDGDNVLEDNETLLPAGTLGELGVDGTASITLADSHVNIWGDDGPVAGSSTRYVGKAWCFGEFTINPVAEGDNDPLVDPGFTCNGANENNITQTDSMTADIGFRAVQARHNADFSCRD
ncbi:MAG: TasA family protein [Patescibacteria group bacterium]|nr:TasA family protein [Patescibacteria group bacterium]